MKDDFFHKFPTTSHLLDLGGTLVRSEKLLPPENFQLFFANPVHVEEKVDGANIGFSLSSAGEIRAQNRGNYIDHTAHKQFQPLRQWIKNHEDSLFEMLHEGRMLFGEWCYATHTIPYCKLPDWFLAFDIYDLSSGKFLGRDQRHDLLKGTDIAEVPYLGRMRINKQTIVEMLSEQQSKLYDGPMEGIYLRVDSRAGYLLHRAKVVRPGFIQSIDRHWSRNKFAANRRER